MKMTAFAFPEYISIHVKSHIVPTNQLLSPFPGHAGIFMAVLV